MCVHANVTDGAMCLGPVRMSHRELPMLVICLGHLLGQRGLDEQPKDHLQGHLRRTTWEIILPLGKARIFPWTLVSENHCSCFQTSSGRKPIQLRLLPPLQAPAWTSRLPPRLSWPQRDQTVDFAQGVRMGLSGVWVLTGDDPKWVCWLCG